MLFSHSLRREGGAPWRMCLTPVPGGRSSAEKIPYPRCGQRRAMASSSSPMANRMMRARWTGVPGRYGSCTGEARRMWSAVCSHSFTAARRRGAKMTPGGGSRTSASRTLAQCASW